MGQGREAVTVRQAILIAVLVGAAFLGGAVVNSTGVQWVQSRVLRMLGLKNGGEIAAVDLESSGNGPIGLEAPESLERPTASSSSSAPSVPEVSSEEPFPKKDPSKDGIEVKPGPQISRGGPGLERSPDTILPSATSARPVTKSSSGATDLVDHNVVRAGGSARPQLSFGPSPPETGGTRAQTPSNSPSAVLPGESSVKLDAKPGPSQVERESTRFTAQEWASVESRMQTLGVSRFTAEGKPGGPITFACFVPLAGRQAISERFEAEGEDVIQAAKAVLRRIVLWRATQPTRHE
jgi:hypothetical protein